MLKEFLECGEIVAPHGVRGEFKIMPWVDTPDYLLQFPTLYLDNGKNPLAIKHMRVHKSAVLVTIEGCDSRDDVMALRGKTVYISREDDPDKDTPFLQDYIGVLVTDIDTGKEYGVIVDAMITGANDVYVVKNANGKDYLIPDIPPVVIETDIKNRSMKIRPLKGLFDDEN